MTWTPVEPTSPSICVDASDGDPNPPLGEYMHFCAVRVIENGVATASVGEAEWPPEELWHMGPSRDARGAVVFSAFWSETERSRFVRREQFHKGNVYVQWLSKRLSQTDPDPTDLWRD